MSGDGASEMKRKLKSHLIHGTVDRQRHIVLDRTSDFISRTASAIAKSIGAEPERAALRLAASAT